ncbi:MerR family transcriptional regulator [Enterococcus faecalis]
MEYTIKQTAELAGVTPRTLRYYDAIGLLKPARVNTAGYRIYGSREIDQLQQILFYRSLDLKLDQIQAILAQSDTQVHASLQAHYYELIEKRNQLDQLIQTIKKTLHYQKGALTMTDSEKFIGLKQAKLEQNERQYGKEIRETYGTESAEKANQKWLSLSEADYEKMQQTEAELFALLKKVLVSQDYNASEAKAAFEKHRDWLQFTTPHYSAQMHKSLGETYVADPRFAAYYDQRVGENAAHTLCQLIQLYG